MRFLQKAFHPLEIERFRELTSTSQSTQASQYLASRFVCFLEMSSVFLSQKFVAGQPKRRSTKPFPMCLCDFRTFLFQSKKVGSFWFS